MLVLLEECFPQFNKPVTDIKYLPEEMTEVPIDTTPEGSFMPTEQRNQLINTTEPTITQAYQHL